MSTSTFEDTAVTGIETPTLMKAAVVHRFTAPLRFQEVAVPVPGAGEVLVRIEASGLCHTDIHAAHGDWPVKPTPPFVPGHEGVGIVEQLGAGVTQSAVGDRVAMPWLGYACGSCGYCVSGWETLCDEPAEHRLLGRRRLRRVRRGARAASSSRCPTASTRSTPRPLTCAGVTTYKAVKVVRRAARPTWWPSSASAASATWRCSTRGSPARRVVAVDVDDEKLDLARELGADHVVNARERGPGRGDPGARRCRRRDRAGRRTRRRSSRPSPRCAAAARSCSSRCRRRTRVELPIFETVLNGHHGHRLDRRHPQDLAEVFALHAAGRTRVVREARQLDEVNEAIADVEAGRVPARVVFEL